MFQISLFSGSKDIRSGASGSVIIKFGSALFTFLNGVLLARLLTVEGFGLFVLALSTAMILAVPASLGLPNLITRYISKYEVDNDLSAIKGLLIQSNSFVAYSTLVIYAISAALYWLWWHSLDPVLVHTMLYGFLIIPLMGYGALRAASLRGMKLIILAELPDTLVRNSLMTLGILVCTIMGASLTPVSAMQLMVLATAFGFVLGYAFQKKYVLSMLKGVVPSFASREWLREGIPFSINSGTQIVKSRILTYVLAVFGSIEAVAVFEVAVRGAKLVSFTLDALNRAIAPFISSAYERRQRETLQRVVKKTSRLVFLSSLPVAIVFVVGGPPLVQWIFGVEYDVAFIPLIILCAGELVSALAGSVGLLLNMTGNQAVFSRSNILALVINAVISIPLVSYFGAIGAATIYSLVLILQNFWLLHFVYKELRINATAF